MEIRILSVGKLKEKYLSSAQESLLTEISKRHRVRLVEIKDEKTIDGAGTKEEERVRNIEGQRILSTIKEKGRVIVLDVSGKAVSSDYWSKKIRESDDEKGLLYLIIGGSLGISTDVLKLSDERVSFSRMTYPHQLFRIMLLHEIAAASK
ncbi:23S rRNA (pseudouridine(1915)-N(3))-methyltransferase RlmH [Youngiibacter multivorans]|uniref:23S rRNA (Pseudouridine1915-N3)-methyltransferase n=1 Tax=Youngiibacter multivorans TaxID=937251 RepID=A0ABS4FZ57_9CLOT|nr:23S rRNA (pseudouridine(1915)-N(3))-methyltransferase RlmH [Youngiibacter multivorans]MBP1917589.1 23S rRNA (pseudouridine1915-N3)-methyltransferase [Youngiibacter multivorans]